MTDESAIKYVANRCNVSREVAQIALDHSRGSIPHAIDALTDDTLKGIYIKEAREYGLG